MPQTSSRTGGARCPAGAPTAGTRSTRSRRLRGLRRRAPAPGGTREAPGESCPSCALRSFGFAGQVAHDVDFGTERQALPQPSLSLLYGCAMELSLADVLDGLISRTGGGQRARIHLRVRELPRERHYQALDIDESVGLKELLARTWPAERHHRRLVADLFSGGEAERCQRPGSGRHLNVTPDRYPGAPAGAEHPEYLGNRTGCGAPDPPEAGDDIERGRIPRQGVHIADHDVGF